MDIFESKDKRGRKQLEFLVHFQGWSSNWDRRVSEDFVLQDTAENRKLQRDLAEKSQLQLGAYLYRKERKKRRKLSEKIKMLQMKSNPEATTEELEAVKNEVEQEEDSDKITDPEEYYSSSTAESYHEDDRVFLNIGLLLKLHLEVDNRLITKEKMLVKLPAALSVITILENFVKYYAIKQITGPQETPKPKRRNSIMSKKESKMFDIKQIEINIDLCKEVADGLRIYLNFILKDFLLYPQEKDQIGEILSPENLKNFVFTPDEVTLDILPNQPVESAVDQESQDSKSDASRRLRSHSIREDSENAISFDFRQENLSSMASTSSNESISLASQKTNKLLLRSSLHMGIPPVAKKLFDEVLAWKIIPADAPVEPSMLFGIVHLTRLVVKLPEFLSATPISEEKLVLLLKYFNYFVEFLEDHEHLYGEHNYKSSVQKAEDEEVIDKKVDSKGSDVKKNELKKEIENDEYEFTDERIESPKSRITSPRAAKKSPSPCLKTVCKSPKDKGKEKGGKSPVSLDQIKEEVVEESTDKKRASSPEEIELIDERFR